MEHPAAKMLVLASQQQEQECGDATNFVLIFAGALLENAEELVRMVGRNSEMNWEKHADSDVHKISQIYFQVKDF